MNKNTDANSTFSTTLNIPGYVVDEQILNQTCDYLENIFDKYISNDEIETLFVVYNGDDERLRFFNRNELFDNLSSSDFALNSMQIDYEVRKALRVEIFFDSDGTINLLTFGPSSDIRFITDGLIRILNRSEREYNWLERKIGLSPKKKLKITSMLLPVTLGYFLIEVAYYFYALEVGVNIDQSLIYTDNRYYSEVANALGNVPIEQKLDVLLRGQIKNFKNVSDVIDRTKLHIKISGFILLLLLIIDFCILKFRKLYPLSFFKIGKSKETLEKIEKKRELWIWCVMVALIVNIFAGLIVAFFA